MARGRGAWLAGQAARSGMLACLLQFGPVAAEGGGLPEALLPPGTQFEPLDGMEWHGMGMSARALRIPLPLASALEAVAAEARVPLRLTVHRGELFVAPAQPAPGEGWVLALRPAAGETEGVLSRLGQHGRGGAPPAPAWLPPGMRTRLDVRDGAGGRQTIHTHESWSVLALSTLVFGRLRTQGWMAESQPAPPLSRWRKGRERVVVVFVGTQEGAGVYTYSEVYGEAHARVGAQPHGPGR